MQCGQDIMMIEYHQLRFTNTLGNGLMFDTSLNTVYLRSTPKTGDD